MFIWLEFFYYYFVWNSSSKEQCTFLEMFLRSLFHTFFNQLTFSVITVWPIFALFLIDEHEYFTKKPLFLNVAVRVLWRCWKVDAGHPELPSISLCLVALQPFLSYTPRGASSGELARCYVLIFSWMEALTTISTCLLPSLRKN